VPSSIVEGTVRGLAAGPDDFAFAPGLVYLQTGSLGPTPRPVMESVIAAWKKLESDPIAQGMASRSTPWTMFARKPRSS
jgi:hypothetical protein